MGNNNRMEEELKENFLALWACIVCSRIQPDEAIRILNL